MDILSFFGEYLTSEDKYENGKSSTINQISIKEICQKERDKDDDGKYMHSITEIIDKDNLNINEPLSEEKISKILNRLEIEINLLEPKNPTYTYICRALQKEEFDIVFFENVTYDQTKKIQKNCVKLLVFIDQVKKYVKQIQDEIKLKTKVKLLLTLFDNKQSQQTLYSESEREEDIIDLMDEKCLSYFEYNNSKFEYIDENVLVYGIFGEKPGLIFLFNELCNDDYSLNENNEK